MSFASTPLGQGRRLDHQTFLGKQNNSGQFPQPSYSYGAPALGSRSPPKPSSSVDNDDSEPALARFARYKQQAEHVNRPGGAKINNSPPKPDKWAVKDTTVNIANAFTLAASTDPDMSGTAAYNNPNNSWASTSQRNGPVPRSTSVEYESSAPAVNLSRRLAPPPNKLSRGPPSSTASIRKPPSKSASSSFLQVPDSGGEDDGSRLNGRAKSPLGALVSGAKKFLEPAVYYVRQASREPEDRSGDLTRPEANHTTNDSYSYEQEDRDFQEAKARHRRNRMSVDNKAYKPPPEEEEESEGYSDDEKKRRRKKGKKGPLGGPLTSLPTVGPDKRRKKRPQGSRGNVAEGDEGDSANDDEYTEEQSSVQIRSSVARTSQPPHSTSRYSQDVLEGPSYEESMSAEQGLHSIPEVQEDDIVMDSPAHNHQSSQNQQQSQKPPSVRSRTPKPKLSSPHFSIGAILGTIVRYSLNLVAIVCYFGGLIIGTCWDVVIRRPLTWLRGAPSARVVLKYLIPGLVLLTAWFTINTLQLSFPSPFRKSTTYRAPDLPPGSLDHLTERLLKMETAVSGLSDDTARNRAQVESSTKTYSQLVAQIKQLEAQLAKEKKAARDSEAKVKESMVKTVADVKMDVQILQSQVEAAQRQQDRPSRGGEVLDEEAKAKLRLLEERVGGVEGSVKEALELGKKASSIAASIPTHTAASSSSGPGAAWWSKLSSASSSKNGVQIKTTDGQDISGIISTMVINALTRDIVGKADFAMHSAGGRVIPSLTSETFEIKPEGITGRVVGLISGVGSAIGRPPITALNHESHSGYCWPFFGSQGQLGVSLAAPVFISEVTIDHIHTDVAFDIRSAPREMEVWGFIDGQDNIDKVNRWREEKKAWKESGAPRSGLDLEDDEEPYDESKITNPSTLSRQYLRLASFTYDIYTPQSVQTFKVHSEIRNLGVDFGIVVLRVLNNWGWDELTCLYRFRVHGQKLAAIAPPTWEELAAGKQPPTVGDGRDA